MHGLPPHNNLIITAVSQQDKPATSMGTTDKRCSPSNAFVACNNTRDSSIKAATGESGSCLLAAAAGTGLVTRFPSALHHASMAAACSPFSSAPNSHSYGCNCLMARSTPCHSDLCPTTVMPCDQAEKSQGCFPYRSPSAEILHPLAVPLYKWLSKT